MNPQPISFNLIDEQEQGITAKHWKKVVLNDYFVNDDRKRGFLSS